MILSVDLMHLYKFYEPIFQCKFSSCLGKNYYVDKKGIVSFCPNHLKESVVGLVNGAEKFKDSDLYVSVLKKAIDKRDNCKATCKYYEYCAGGCPLEDGCCGFPEEFTKSSTHIDNILKNSEDLGKENYAVAKIIIKDVVYDE
jgi:radical SAM protein with 4Fe4S-binding SPASM domain